MKTLCYADQRLIVTDGVGALVLAYATELAQHRTADAVDIPVLSSSGSVGTASLLLGPASQIAVAEAEEAASIFVDTSAAEADLRERIAHFQNPHEIPVDSFDDLFPSFED